MTGSRWVAWQLSAMYLVTSPTWPTVTRIFEAWFENIADGTLAGHLLATFWRQMLGYGLAVVLGIAAWSWSRGRAEPETSPSPSLNGQGPIDPELERRVDEELIRLE